MTGARPRLSLGHCVKCGGQGLVGPLHLDRGGPIFCLPCGTEWHAEQARRRNRGEMQKRFMDMAFGRTAYAGSHELTLDLIEEAVRLTHPDKHPPERATEASMNNVTMGFSLISVPPLSLRPGIARGASHARRTSRRYPDRPHERWWRQAMTEPPERRFERLRLAYPSGAAVMAFYAGGAMPDEVPAPQLLAVVEVVEASRGERRDSEADRP
jgi:hypothetical protein